MHLLLSRDGRIADRTELFQSKLYPLRLDRKESHSFVIDPKNPHLGSTSDREQILLLLDAPPAG